MAHAFDNRNLLPAKQQTFYSLVSPSPSSRPDVTNVLWETSSKCSPQSSPRPNHPPPSYEESVFNKALANRHSSRSSLHSPSLQYYPHSPSMSYSLPCTPNVDSTSSTHLFDKFASPLNRSSDTKPPPPARIPKGSLINPSPNGMKTSTTYLNSTQLYINQQSSPPPPPPRYPLNPPAIPPRTANVMMSSPKPTSQIIYRSSTVKPNDCQILERQMNCLSIENRNDDQCGKCRERFSNNDNDRCHIRGQVYHNNCAVCVVCQRSVKNKYFIVKDQLYCEEDFIYTGYHQTLEHCVACRHLITDTILQALGQSYHLSCFKCSKCSICLDGIPFITDQNKDLFCLHDYHMTYGPRCDKCSNPICPEENSNETIRIISMGKTFHVQCYRCEDCSLQLNDEPNRRCYPLAETLLCQGCCRRRLVSAQYHLQ